MDSHLPWDRHGDVAGRESRLDVKNQNPNPAPYGPLQLSNLEV